MRRYVSPLSKLSIDTKAGADGAAAAEADGMIKVVDARQVQRRFAAALGKYPGLWTTSWPKAANN
jgi:hypothetical protein